MNTPLRVSWEGSANWNTPLSFSRFVSAPEGPILLCPPHHRSVPKSRRRRKGAGKTDSRFKARARSPRRFGRRASITTKASSDMKGASLACTDLGEMELDHSCDLIANLPTRPFEGQLVSPVGECCVSGDHDEDEGHYERVRPYKSPTGGQKTFGHKKAYFSEAAALGLPTVSGVCFEKGPLLRKINQKNGVSNFPTSILNSLSLLRSTSPLLLLPPQGTMSRANGSIRVCVQIPGLRP